MYRNVYFWCVIGDIISYLNKKKDRRTPVKSRNSAVSF